MRGYARCKDNRYGRETNESLYTARGEGFTAEVESFAVEEGLQVIGRIPYDPGVTQRTMEEKSVVEDEQTTAGAAMREIYARFEKQL